MLDYLSSKMVQSAARNEARIKGMLKEYRKAPDADPNHTIFTRRNADEKMALNIGVPVSWLSHLIILNGRTFQR